MAYLVSYTATVLGSTAAVPGIASIAVYLGFALCCYPKVQELTTMTRPTKRLCYIPRTRYQYIPEGTRDISSASFILSVTFVMTVSAIPAEPDKRTTPASARAERKQKPHP